MVPPAATSRRAWRSRIRSMALRMLRALANRGCAIRSATYSVNAARACADSWYCSRSSISPAICVSSSSVKSGKSMWCATREAIPGLDRKNTSIRSAYPARMTTRSSRCASMNWSRISMASWP